MPRLVFSALCCALLSVIVSPAFGQDEEKGAFARGGKLPGDLSDLLDADADGMVTDNEAQNAAKEFARQAESKDDRGKALLEALDTDKDGKVGEMEAQDAVAELRAEQDEAGKYVADIFNKLDANQDRIVTQEEFNNMDETFGRWARFMKPRIGRMLGQFDVNRDNMISFTESQMAAEAFSQQAGLERKQKEAAAEARYLNAARPVFATLDANRNNLISFREAKRDDGFNSVFTTIDVDGDKNASVAEVVAYLKAIMPAEEKEDRGGFDRGGFGGERGFGRGGFGRGGFGRGRDK